MHWRGRYVGDRAEGFPAEGSSVRVRQQRADIDALYELVERVDEKVDALDIKLDRRFDEISGQLSDVLRQLGGR